MKRFFMLICMLGFSVISFGHEAAVHSTAPLGQTIGQYIGLGFTHILPKGLDHILFVLGLYFASQHWRTLFIQVSAFTVAHTITLALAILGVFSLPDSFVEPIIALSIAVIGIENVIFKDPPRWRWIIVFAFGLIHGMGFAGVLHELGLPEGRLWSSLLSFNVGVELGQIAVIALACGITTLILNKPWYRQRVVIPASIAISLVGLFWFIERTII